jgi:hypothetical protein
VEFWTGLNPDFFKNTAVEAQATKWLKARGDAELPEA